MFTDKQMDGKVESMQYTPLTLLQGGEWDNVADLSTITKTIIDLCLIFLLSSVYI
jgi:hypothetical protein